jgi:hypothetical protein
MCSVILFCFLFNVIRVFCVVTNSSDVFTVFLLAQLMCDEYNEHEKRRTLMEERLQAVRRQQGLMSGMFVCIRACIYLLVKYHCKEQTTYCREMALVQEMS